MRPKKGARRLNSPIRSDIGGSAWKAGDGDGRREVRVSSGKVPTLRQSHLSEGPQSWNAGLRSLDCDEQPIWRIRPGSLYEDQGVKTMKASSAKFALGQVVRHRVFDFRGLVFDVDPEFDNTEDWWLSIPEEVRPHKDQPFYHLFAENAETEYIAYVSEQNLLPDHSGEPLRHPQIADVFDRDEGGSYRMRLTVPN